MLKCSSYVIVIMSNILCLSGLWLGPKGQREQDSGTEKHAPSSDKPIQGSCCSGTDVSLIQSQI